METVKAVKVEASEVFEVFPDDGCPKWVAWNVLLLLSDGGEVPAVAEHSFDESVLLSISERGGDVWPEWLEAWSLGLDLYEAGDLLDELMTAEDGASIFLVVK
jgi:hypothetical protein